MKGTTNKWLALELFLVTSLLAGVLSSLNGPNPWYAMAAQPAWGPPDWLRAPVSAVLYFLMGMAAWLAWRPAGWRGAHALFVVQLVFNAAWTWLFFDLHRPGWALGDLTLLGFTALLTCAGFWRIRPLAGALLLPYLAWLAYAWTVNFGFWWLNGGRLPFI